MKIAIIGYGKMGQAIEQEALQQGHEVALRLDVNDTWPAKIEADVAVEFTSPTAAVGNIRRCFERQLPVVCGTTGWYAQYDAVCHECHQMQCTLLTATNFSLGMNILFLVNEHLAALMRNQNYHASITETHHVHKLDAPSGTAITLQQQIVQSGSRPASDVPITSVREGEVPGTHTVVYNSPLDTITITHEAHSRRGLAQGAVRAAEWLTTAAPGVYTMKDLLG